MNRRLSPLCLILLLSTVTWAQQVTSNGWAYEVLKPGSGPQLSPQHGALTHNQLLDANGRILVSTYKIGVPDYERVADLAPALQKAFSVMKQGGKYRFQIPIREFEQTMRSPRDLGLPGENVTWEMELLEVLPPLPDASRLIAEAYKAEGAAAAFAHFNRLTESQEAYLGEWEVNQIGYLFLQGEHYEQAVKVLAYNTGKYPNSANAHDSLAEAYYKSGDKGGARKAYQRSLQLNPKNDNAREMLEKL